MKTNKEKIAIILQYIEDHLDENLSLDSLAQYVGYSKYHLHRMLSELLGMPIHLYIQKRRLSKAAYELVHGEKEIVEIALAAGYSSQQAFHLAFKKGYKKTPDIYRREQKYYPLLLSYDIEKIDQKSKFQRFSHIQIIENRERICIGYSCSTLLGFFMIGETWRKMHRHKQWIANRTNHEFLIGINDYSRCKMDKDHLTFDYYAMAEVDGFETIPKGMVSKVLPASDYAVFYLRGKKEESVQPWIESIYKEWFLKTDYELNDALRFDFIRYGEIEDENKESQIEIWIPIKRH